METSEKIFLALIAAVLLTCWGLWFKANSATVEACFNNYEECQAAYYSEN